MGETKRVIMIPTVEDDVEEGTVRVAAYCRVSSLPQEESYESQVNHFESTISTHESWTLVKVYGDEGITGLNTYKRNGFKQMLRDGKNGKFDLLLVKSISRLGRNTVDLLQSVRALKSAGVVCYFEKENLRTDASSGELMITLLSAFAQMESESISANVRIGIGYKMARGEWSVAYSTFLGYDRVNGEIVINLEQAETVRLIYEWFLSGYSLGQIVKRLEEEQRLTGKGSTSWSKSSVKRILQNRKYCGDVVLQLTVTEDVLTKHRVANTGQAPQYLVMDGIPAIISRQTYWLTQGELERRSGIVMGKFSGMDISRYDNGFTGKLKCSCGANYNRVNARHHYVWKCRNRIVSECRSAIVSEAELEAVVLKGCQWLWNERPTVRLASVAFVDEDSSPEELMAASKAYVENRFLQRIIDFLGMERPTKYSAQLLEVVERIDFDKAYTIRFYNGSVTKVNRMKVIAEENIVISTEKEAQEKTCFNVCGESRKRLVNRLSSLTGVKATYLGYPSMAFAVGDLIVERDGTVEGKLSKRVLKALERSGFRIDGK